MTQLLDQYGRPYRPETPRRLPVRARYDLDRETTATQRHWQGVDSMSARNANSPDVRKKAREKARYECENNGHASGLVESVAHDVIGTGPRLQLTLPGGGPGDARLVERRLASWADDRLVDLPDNFRVMSQSETRDGEGFGLLFTNEAVEDAVKLAVRVIETDQIETPVLGWGDAGQVSGVEFDKSGNPAFYHILKEHPGDGIWQSTDKYDRVPARYVLHWFRKARAGQARGMPRITPGITLFNQLRRYGLATLTAAEVQASLTAFLKSDLPADYTGQPPAPSTDPQDYFDALEIVRGMMSTLPPGTDITFPNPTHPHGNYEAFKSAVLTEIGRSVHAPRNVVTGDSSNYNYSSARLDWVIYYAAIRVERARFVRQVMNPIFRAWVAEARLIPGYLPADLPPISEWVWTWHFDAPPSIDPVKDATAAGLLLDKGLTDYGREYAQMGADWEEGFEAIARQRKRAKELGIDDLLWPKAMAPAAQPQPEPPDEPPDDGDERQPVGARHVTHWDDTPLDVGGAR